MGYRISYQGKEPQKYRNRQKRGGVIFVCSLIVAVAMFLHFKDVEISSTMRRFFMPGSTAETELLLEEAVEKIHQGGSVVEALHTFCMEVISDARN